MRLINTETLQIEEFFDDGVPWYAILSHTWGEEEVSFEDMQDLDRAHGKRGFVKVQRASELARSEGYDYVWVDTCCINKASSAELSEAINSMYLWYKESAICYAYLEDCPYFPPPRGDGGRPEAGFREAFGKCRWATRGWTLQELIAPKFVRFYSADWQPLGDKAGLQDLIADVTGIDLFVLNGGDPLGVSVARKMSWAANRQTTRVEDTAYCLMGLFGVNMPLLYGERTKSFFRLQEEILKISNDQSIFAWGSLADRNRGEAGRSRSSFLASSPRAFAETGKKIALFGSQRTGGSAASSISDGIKMELLLMPLKHDRDHEATHLGVLHCQFGPIPGTCPAIRLMRLDSPACYSTDRRSKGVIDSVTIRPLNREPTVVAGFDPLNKDSIKNMVAIPTGLTNWVELEIEPCETWTLEQVTIANEPFVGQREIFHIVTEDGITIVNVATENSWDQQTSTLFRRPRNIYSSRRELESTILVRKARTGRAGAELIVVYLGLYVGYRGWDNRVTWYSCLEISPESEVSMEGLAEACPLPYLPQLDSCYGDVYCAQSTPPHSTVEVKLEPARIFGRNGFVLNIRNRPLFQGRSFTR